jgi:hypothetical protein
VQKKTFKGKRPITITIDDNMILFLYKNEDNREFYYTPVNEWVAQHENPERFNHTWEKQLNKKNWYTQEMQDFINKHTIQRR